MKEENSKVLRGGSWDSHPRNCRSTCRNYNDPDNRYSHLGFRVVCEGEEPADKVMRGGSWILNARRCRSAVRSYYDPESQYVNVSFRVVCEEEKV